MKPLSKKKLLIVEDDQVISYIYNFKFREAGFVVELAGDGQMALDKLRDELPDVILLDLLLPKLNGIEVLKQIRAESRSASLPIVVFTNTFLRDMIQEARDAGANECLIKANCSPDAVIEVVRRVLMQPGKKPMPTKGHVAIPFPAGSKLLVSMRETEEKMKVQQRSKFLVQAKDALADIKGILTEISHQAEKETLLRSLRMLFAKAHSLTSNAAIVGFNHTAWFISAFEALVKEICDAPEQMTASVQFTLVETVELVALVLQNTNPIEAQTFLNLRLLIVDDDPVSQKAMAMAAEKVGLQVTEVLDSSHALRILESRPFDLILLDLEMPNLNGLEIYQHLRTLPAHAETPVIFVTDLADFDRRAHAAAQTQIEVLGKPFLPIELAVKSLIAVLRGMLKKGHRKHVHPPSAAEKNFWGQGR